VQELANETLYTRIDAIVIDDVLFVMEIELIEPYLFLESERKRQE
jgi:hypothetical protein